MNAEKTLNLEKAIERAIDYLYQHQYPNGEYCCYMGPDDALQEWCVPDSNVFPASLIAYCLKNFKENIKVDQILQRTAGFLQYQAMRGGVWNNFTRWHALFPFCPADVDNTVCASKALQFMGKDFVENTEILLANRNKAGLFYTWYALRPNRIRNKNFWLLLLREYKHPVTSFFFWKRNECSRYDIDAVVNANVLFYLGNTKMTQPIIPYLIDVIKNQKEADCDKWYRSPFTVYYFISRNYEAGIQELEPVKELIITRILATAKADGALGESILDTALGLSALLDLGYDPVKTSVIAEYLISKQGTTGDWPRWALFYSGPKKEVCWGSEEFTTAYCLESLGKYKLTSKRDHIIFD